MTMPEAFSAAGRVYGDASYATPLLGDIAAQAVQADRTRSVSPELIARLKDNDIMRMSASHEISGLDESVVAIGNELRAIAARCSSTAWCMWNHLCTLHHFVGLLGPAHRDFFAEAVAKRQWFCFPAGAATEIKGVEKDGVVTFTGKATFGSGARYADWAGVVFMREGVELPQFTLADLRRPGVRVDPTWDGMSVRASATDHIHYTNMTVPAERLVPWWPRHREHLRRSNYAVIAHRYREDWAALAVLWLGAMASGLAEVSFQETISGIRDRVAIVGVRMADRPTIHVNLGRAQAFINAATDTVYAAMVETDARIRAKITPTEGDYFRQCSAGMQAVLLCEEAMQLILRVLGGNGLREGSAFERHFRDFQAMPLHILGHVDRVTEQMGRLALGLETQNFF